MLDAGRQDQSKSRLPRQCLSWTRRLGVRDMSDEGLRQPIESAILLRRSLPMAFDEPCSRKTNDVHPKVVAPGHDPVVCQNSADRLGGPPFVVIENSAQQPFTPLNWGIHVDHCVPFLDQPIVEPLMIPLNVIVLHVFLNSVA